MVYALRWDGWDKLKFALFSLESIVWGFETFKKQILTRRFPSQISGKSFEFLFSTFHINTLPSLSFYEISQSHSIRLDK